MPTGRTGFSMITDNVEAFAPGNPIFASSGDDNLTGSTVPTTCSSSRSRSATT